MAGLFDNTTGMAGGLASGGTLTSNFNPPLTTKVPDSLGGSLNILGANLTAPNLNDAFNTPTSSTTPSFSTRTTPGTLGNGANAPVGLAPFNPANPTATPNAPQTSTAQGSAGLTDMSGKTWGANNTVIPQGWFMDGQGNWTYKGTQSPQTSGVTTLPASYVSTAFNPAETAANLKAGGYTQQPDGSWTNTTKAEQDWNLIYNSGTAPAGSLNGVTGYNQGSQGGSGSVAPPAGVASPTSTGSNQNSNSYLQQLLQSLLGSQQSQAQSQVVKTPLGYTQYQSQVPQGSNALQQMLLQALQGNSSSNTGGTQGSFWDLLSGGNSGSNSNSSILPLILSLLGGSN